MQNPKEKLSELTKCFAYRRIFVTALLDCAEIPFTLQQLIQILELIKGQSTDFIKSLFKVNPAIWIKQANLDTLKEANKENELSLESI